MFFSLDPLYEAYTFFRSTVHEAYTFLIVSKTISDKVNYEEIDVNKEPQVSSLSLFFVWSMNHRV